MRSDKGKFEKQLANLFRKNNITEDVLKKMSAKELLILLLQTLPSSALQYSDVDKKKVPPLEWCLKKGKGDCDKYASLARAIFHHVKNRKLNDRLNNIYILDHEAGAKDFGLTQFHDWVVIAIVKKNELIISHVDPTFSDNGSSFEGTTDYHVPENAKEFWISFFSYLEDHVAMIKLLMMYPYLAFSSENDVLEKICSRGFLRPPQEMRLLGEGTLELASDFFDAYEHLFETRARECMLLVLFDLEFLFGDKDKAEAHYQKFLEITPSDEESVYAILFEDHRSHLMNKK